MKTKKTKSFPLVISIIIIILYIILAARPLAKEYSFSPVWKIDTTAKMESIDSFTQIPFKLNQTLGYFSEDGKLLFVKPFPSKATISDFYYSIYNTSGDDISIYDRKGDLYSTIKASGFPYFENDNLFVFLSGGSSFAKYSTNGNLLWLYEGVFPITAFSSNQKYTAVGFVDGIIKLFDNSNGSSIMTYEPAGSNYPIILGLSVSKDGQYIASVSGQEEQRFVIAKNENNKSKIIYHEFLNSEITRRTQVYFSEDGKRVLFDCGGRLGIYDIEKDKAYSVKIDKQIISVEESENLIFLLGKEASEYTVYVIEKTNILEGSFTFKANNAFIKTYNEALYVGKDSTISKIELTRD
ncbi:MAG: hypothetical protein K5829_00450 [Treponema sp.]|nr:hypothetical protein [Treponema sp.]